MARRSKLTDDLQRSIVNAVIEGATLQIAAEAASCAVSTVYEWRKRGEQILAGETAPAQSPLEVECPSCQAPAGAACHSLRQPDRLIHPHKSRSRLASDPQRDAAYARFAEALSAANATGAVLDLHTVGIASRPRKVKRVTTKSFPVKIRGEVILDEHGRPMMATETITVEWEEVDAKPAQWRLARRYPDNYGDRVTTRLEGALEVGPPPIRLEEDSDESLERVAAALIEAGAFDGLDEELEQLAAGAVAAAADAEAPSGVLPAAPEPEAEGVPPPGVA